MGRSAGSTRACVRVLGLGAQGLREHDRSESAALQGCRVERPLEEYDLRAHPRPRPSFRHGRAVCGGSSVFCAFWSGGRPTPVDKPLRAREGARCACLDCGRGGGAAAASGGRRLCVAHAFDRGCIGRAGVVAAAVEGGLRHGAGRVVRGEEGGGRRRSRGVASPSIGADLEACVSCTPEPGRRSAARSSSRLALRCSSLLRFAFRSLAFLPALVLLCPCSQRAHRTCWGHDITFWLGKSTQYLPPQKHLDCQSCSNSDGPQWYF